MFRQEQTLGMFYHPKYTDAQATTHHPVCSCEHYMCFGVEITFNGRIVVWTRLRVLRSRFEGETLCGLQSCR